MSTAVIASVQDVYKTYEMGPVTVEALRGVDIDFYERDYISIMGPSGCGKSTLMNLLGCLDRPTSGRYLLAGSDVAQMEDEELSRIRGEHIGFVFQAFNLIAERTVLENVEVPLFYQGVSRSQRRWRSESAIERVGLTDRLGHRPSELSGGQQQRVAIARAMVTEPSVLLADEPTGNLDSETGEAILQIFDELHRDGMTIIVVTHDDHIADRCQRVVQLLDGRIDSDELTLG